MPMSKFSCAPSDAENSVEHLHQHLAITRGHPVIAMHSMLLLRCRRGRCDTDCQ